MSEKFRRFPVLKSFEKLNIEILIQTQKIENLNFEIRPKGLFTHQKSNKRAKNLHGTSNGSFSNNRMSNSRASFKRVS